VGAGISFENKTKIVALKFLSLFERCEINSYKKYNFQMV